MCVYVSMCLCDCVSVCLSVCLCVSVSLSLCLWLCLCLCVCRVLPGTASLGRCHDRTCPARSPRIDLCCLSTCSGRNICNT